MTRSDRVSCTRCGRNRAFSEADWVRVADKAGPPHAPPVPPGLCIECAFKDPEQKEAMRAWAKETGAWGEQRMREYLRQLREFLARPLEAIDRFVDSFR